VKGYSSSAAEGTGVSVDTTRVEDATKAFVLPPGQGTAGPVRGPWATRVRGSDTNGLVSIGEADMPPRTSGPALHVHSREDEVTLVVEGVMTVQLGTERFEVPAGGIAWLPRGIPHAFANLSDGRVKAIGLIVPAGLERMFAEREAYLASLDGPPDPAWFAEQNARYGVASAGPPIEVPTPD
jgi:mannose-6-phosphate isomerase-like protein (cupin superfamily)